MEDIKKAKKKAARTEAKKAAYVCGGFANAVEGLSNGIRTGAPIRHTLYEGNAAKARADLGITSNKPVLLVMGGSSGAAAINTALAGCLTKLTQKYEVIHLTGKGKPSCIIPPPDSRYPQATNHYHPIEFSANIQDLFAMTSLCITRGGAGALFELTALRIPSLIIPLPKSRSSRGDQVQNAKYFEQRGCATVLEQKNLTPENLLLKIEELSVNATALKAAMSTATGIDGSGAIVDLIKSI